MKEWFQRDGWILVVGVLVALAILTPLARGLWGQVEQLKLIREAEAELLPVLSSEQERHEELLLELDHVSSPDYPEEWARIHAGMTRPGEVRLVILLPEEAPTPASTDPPAP